jgi:hypothetical protein
MSDEAKEKRKRERQEERDRRYKKYEEEGGTYEELVDSEDTEEYEHIVSSDEEELKKKCDAFDKKRRDKVKKEQEDAKAIKRKRREEEEASLTEWQKNDEFYNPQLRHKRLKTKEPPKIPENVMKQLEEIKKKISEFLHSVLPEDKQLMANEIDVIPVAGTVVDGKLIEGMVEKFNRNLISCSYVRRLMHFPINMMMQRAGLEVKDIKGGKASIEKFVDLLMEACNILKINRIK